MIIPEEPLYFNTNSYLKCTELDFREKSPDENNAESKLPKQKTSDFFVDITIFHRDMKLSLANLF